MTSGMGPGSIRSSWTCLSLDSKVLSAIVTPIPTSAGVGTFTSIPSPTPVTHVDRSFHHSGFMLSGLLPQFSSWVAMRSARNGLPQYLQVTMFSGIVILLFLSGQGAPPAVRTPPFGIVIPALTLILPLGVEVTHRVPTEDPHLTSPDLRPGGLVVVLKELPGLLVPPRISQRVVLC